MGPQYNYDVTNDVIDTSAVQSSIGLTSRLIRSGKLTLEMPSASPIELCTALVIDDVIGDVILVLRTHPLTK